MASGYQLETSTVLAGAGTFAGPARSAGESESPFDYFAVDCFADQSGTLFIERSMDATTWVAVNGNAGATVTANASVQASTRVVARYYRVRYVNGATPQTVFSVASGFTNA